MAREKYRRGGTKGSKASELPRDEGKHFVPGVLGRGGVKKVDARTGYTKGETRFGPGGRGRVISIPKAKGG
jgi:hypothetical protein